VLSDILIQVKCIRNLYYFTGIVSVLSNKPTTGSIVIEISAATLVETTNGSTVIEISACFQLLLWKRR